MCLDVYARSPAAYASMANSDIFKALPTPRLLRMYKNCVKQETGLVPDNLEWLMAEADKLGYQFGSPDRLGGLSIDEVSIQEINCLFIINLHVQQVPILKTFLSFTNYISSN